MTSVAVVNGRTDHDLKWKSGLTSLHHSKNRFSSSSAVAGGDAADFRPISGLLGSDVGEFIENSGREQRRKQADESLQRVMYFNCWGQG
ncbi:unnamed protein product [Ilex paraguariensis]|uniref:Uncharacterized protein n=1 Tax=Ilex paraguariensis TaxID=185542 RepID=A0ABC8S550_9AQUA